MEHERKPQYENITCNGSFAERAERLLWKITKTSRIEAGFGLGEGHYIDGKIGLEVVVALVIDGEVHAFGIDEATQLAKALKESDENFKNNPWAKVGGAIAESLVKLIEVAKKNEGELRRQFTQ